VIRSDQKLESGALVATTLGFPGAGGFTERLVSPGDDSVEDIITRKAYILSPTAIVTNAVETLGNVTTIATDAAGTGTGKVVLVTLGALSLAGGGYAAFRSTRQ
jgi:hypothetical protein